MVDFDELFGEIDGKSAGLTLIIGAWMAISLLDDPFHTGMDKLPLFFRIVTVILFIPICYFIIKKMTD